MEGIAIGIAKKALDSVVSTAKTAINDEIGLLLGVQEELFFIKEELEMMQAFLRVASAEEAKGEIVTTWVKQVQELSYDVEDSLQEASVHLMNKGCLNAMLSSNARDRIARTIKVLKVRIEDVSKRNLRYGLIKSSTKNVLDDSMEKPLPHWNASEDASVVGLSKPKQELLNLISENHDSLKVISVVGMGGLGKTTLVKSVYGNPELSNEFKSFAWITTLHPFNKEEFILSLAMQLSLVKLEFDEDETKGMRKMRLFKDEDQSKGLKKKKFDIGALEKMIIDHFKDNRFIVVLDDLANEMEWRKVKSIFHVGFKGSRIIVTTRSESLAEHISGSRDIYKVKALSKPDSLDLFYKAVFKNLDYSRPTNGKNHENSNLEESSCSKNGLEIRKQVVVITEEMEKEADKIIERCGQLPLALVAIGSFLATKPKTSGEWNAMHDHITSEISSNSHLESINTVLTTSYDGLPYNLKPCFLYFSVFSNHKEIRRSRIVRRWMAEGFIAERPDISAEEVGERYFYDLMGRSLIQPSETIAIENDAVTRCNIHDLMYDMVVGKSEKEKMVSFLGYRSHINMNDKARHVVIQDGLDEKNSALRRMKLSNIRSVTVFGKVGRYVSYHKMRLLRVLDLEGTMGLKNRDIRKIGKLRLLRYLGLRGTTISKLPGSLEKLHDLETLDIRDTWVLELPRGIVKLQKLSYLRTGFDIYKSPEVFNRFKGSRVLKITAWVIGLSFSFFCCIPVCGGFIFCERAMEEVLNSIAYCTCVCRNYLKEADVGPNKWANYGSFGLKAPQGMRKLRSLRNFGTVAIGQSIASARELKYLINLTKVAIMGFSKNNGEILGEAIEELIHLKSLLLSASDKLGLGCCLNSISTPPKYLHSLKLFSPIDNLPNWLSSLDNLVKLYLRDTFLSMEDINVIEKLSNLKIFFMLEDSFKGEQLCFGPNTFPMLQVLFLENILNWFRREMPLKVLIKGIALQKLTRLAIHDKESAILSSELESRNKNLEVLVPRWELEGLESLRSLKEVVLDNLNVDVVKSIQDMILKNPNNPDVRSLNIPTKAEESAGVIEVQDVNLNSPNEVKESDQIILQDTSMVSGVNLNTPNKAEESDKIMLQDTSMVSGDNLNTPNKAEESNLMILQDTSTVSGDILNTPNKAEESNQMMLQDTSTVSGDILNTPNKTEESNQMMLQDTSTVLGENLNTPNRAEESNHIMLQDTSMMSDVNFNTPNKSKNMVK